MLVATRSRENQKPSPVAGITLHLASGKGETGALVNGRNTVIKSLGKKSPTKCISSGTSEKIWWPDLHPRPPLLPESCPLLLANEILECSEQGSSGTETGCPRKCHGEPCGQET